MNSNELANLLDKHTGGAGNIYQQASTMLRQQQADLKDADKYAFELERLYEDAKAEIEALKRALALKNNWEQISNEIQVKIVNDILRKDNEK